MTHIFHSIIIMGSGIYNINFVVIVNMLTIFRPSYVWGKVCVKVNDIMCIAIERFTTLTSYGVYLCLYLVLYVCGVGFGLRVAVGSCVDGLVVDVGDGIVPCIVLVLVVLVLLVVVVGFGPAGGGCVPGLVVVVLIVWSSVL